MPQHSPQLCSLLEFVHANASAWDAAEELPEPVLEQAAACGLYGCLVPGDYGGWALRYAEYCSMIEAIATRDPGFALHIAAHNSLCTNHVTLFGTEEQKAKYLPRLASGEWTGAWCLTEPEVGSDAGAIQTRATRCDGGWVLNGQKRFITNAKSAALNVVLATVDGTKKGITAFLVESTNPGHLVGERIRTLGMRASETYSLEFADCFVPDNALLGTEGNGLANALTVLDGGRLSIAALSLGLAVGAYQESVRYARKRRQFGKLLIELPTIQEMLVGMKLQVETSRALLEKAIARCDSGQEFASMATMAKLVASEAAVSVSERALQVHGGLGYTAGSRVEKLFRDAKLCTIGEGTSEILKLVISREIVRTEFIDS